MIYKICLLPSPLLGEGSAIVRAYFTIDLGLLYNQEHLASHHHGETATNSPWEHQQQTLNYTSSGAITEQDDNAVYFDGNNVWWHGTGWGKAGTVDGHKYYRGDKYIGRLGADLNVYNSDGNSKTPGTRNRVSLRNVCHPTGPYIETRFLTSPGF